MVVFLLQVDERGVKEVCTFNPSTQGVEHYQYPLAGSKNTTSILKLLEFHFTSSGEVRSPPYTHTHTHKHIQAVPPHSQTSFLELYVYKFCARENAIALYLEFTWPYPLNGFSKPTRVIFDFTFHLSPFTFHLSPHVVHLAVVVPLITSV